jgi:Flp pilus assembly protein TadB
MMKGLIFGAAAFASVAALLWWPPVASIRARASLSPNKSPRRLLAVSMPMGVALAVPVVVDGWSGLVLAATVAVVVYRWRGRSSTRLERLAETRRALSLPIALDILGACLTVGAEQRQALEAVASSIGGSLQQELQTVAGAMRVGADVTEAWSLVDAPDLYALAAVLGRADVTGAPVTPLLALLADQHRQRARAVAMDAARALGVRVAGPLGLCFLPAFVLIAVVPLVISLLPVTF